MPFADSFEVISYNNNRINLSNFIKNKRCKEIQTQICQHLHVNPFDDKGKIKHNSDAANINFEIYVPSKNNRVNCDYNDNDGRFERHGQRFYHFVHCGNQIIGFHPTYLRSIENKAFIQCSRNAASNISAFSDRFGVFYTNKQRNVVFQCTNSSDYAFKVFKMTDDFEQSLVISIYCFLFCNYKFCLCNTQHMHHVLIDGMF